MHAIAPHPWAPVRKRRGAKVQDACPHVGLAELVNLDGVPDLTGHVYKAAGADAGVVEAGVEAGVCWRRREGTCRLQRHTRWQGQSRRWGKLPLVTSASEKSLKDDQSFFEGVIMSTFASTV